MNDFDYTNILQEYVNSKPLRSDAARYGFLLGHTGKVYSFIDHVSSILHEAVKDGDMGRIKEQIERAECFLNAILVVEIKNVDNKSSV